MKTWKDRAIVAFFVVLFAATAADAIGLEDVDSRVKTILRRLGIINAAGAYTAGAAPSLSSVMAVGHVTGAHDLEVTAGQQITLLDNGYGFRTSSASNGLQEGWTCTLTGGTRFGTILNTAFSDGGSDSSTIAVGLSVSPSYDFTAGAKTGTVEALRINPSSTSLPTGHNYLIRAMSSDVDQFSVGMTGKVKTKGDFCFFATVDDLDTPVNSEYMKTYFDGDYFAVVSAKTGTGSLRPIRINAGTDLLLGGGVNREITFYDGANAPCGRIKFEGSGQNHIDFHASAGWIQWGSGGYSSSAGVVMCQSNAGVFALHNYTTAAGFKLYNTTDLTTAQAGGAPTDAEWFGITWSGNVVTLGPGKDGAGTMRQFNITQPGYHELTEISAPSAGAADTGRLYVEDNGSGKSRLVVKFSSGAAQVIATQP